MHKIDTSWNISTELLNKISDYEKSYASAQLSRSIDFYSNRLKQIGFVNKENILDIGCGIGQWSLALSKLNKNIFAVDINEKRLEFGRELNKIHNQKISFQKKSMDELEFEKKFDAIFCYGAFMFSDMPKTLKTFKSCLNRDGKIYLNFNNFGWYLNLLFNKGIFNLNSNNFFVAIKYIFRTMLNLNNKRIVSQKYLEKIAKQADLKVEEINSEGCINLNSTELNPLYKKKYLGFKMVEECILKNC